MTWVLDCFVGAASLAMTAIERLSRGLAADQPHHQRQHDADDDAGDDREVEG
jgi:hypothetical protein